MQNKEKRRNVLSVVGAHRRGICGFGLRLPFLFQTQGDFTQGAVHASLPLLHIRAQGETLRAEVEVQLLMYKGEEYTFVSGGGCRFS